MLQLVQLKAMELISYLLEKVRVYLSNRESTRLGIHNYDPSHYIMTSTQWLGECLKINCTVYQMKLKGVHMQQGDRSSRI